MSLHPESSTLGPRLCTCAATRNLAVPGTTLPDDHLSCSAVDNNKMHTRSCTMGPHSDGSDRHASAWRVSPRRATASGSSALHSRASRPEAAPAATPSTPALSSSAGGTAVSPLLICDSAGV